MKGNQKLAVHVAVFSSTHIILEMVQSRLLHAQRTNRFLYNVLLCNYAFTLDWLLIHWNGMSSQTAGLMKECSTICMATKHIHAARYLERQ